MADGQRTYKDRLFSFIFGNEEHREWTLSLYNAVNGSHYTDPSLLTITTIRDVLYMGMHNDLSFLVYDVMSLYEQQSSFNPNAPLRMLQYAGNLYEKYVTGRKLNKYGTHLIELPVPKLVVFYNSAQDKPDRMELRLSDSFPEGMRGEADIEVRVRMVNVNRGRSAALLDSCRPLWEYAYIVDKVRSLRAYGSLGEAIDRMIEELPEDFTLRPWLREHRAEVKGMLLTEYNETEQMELFREEGRAEGRAEGEAKGRAEGRAKGEAIVTKLLETLFALGRTDDAHRAIVDEAYRRQLYAEFGLD
ncbi:MAG: hypothetical protein E7317_10125 [Clostridiales bacterium]|nr:hypothetical protein [Clostridiales bacterium]